MDLSIYALFYRYFNVRRFYFTLLLILFMISNNRFKSLPQHVFDAKSIPGNLRPLAGRSRGLMKTMGGRISNTFGSVTPAAGRATIA